MNECPYSKTKANISQFNLNAEEMIKNNNKNLDPNLNNKCPFSNKNEDNNETKKEEVDSDDDKPQGGCPVMNKTKKDPMNKHFDHYYEVPFYGPFDFMFGLKGELNPTEFEEKTKKLSGYSRQLKYTLFSHSDENLKKVRDKEFTMIFFVYDDVKDKGNKLFKKKKFREAIKYYQYAYSSIKWLEFKDTTKNANFLATPSLDPILDDDIELKKPFVDGPVVEDSYKASVVYVLMCLSYAYMELRHYSEAIECINESLEIAGDKVPDLYFRRAQAVFYNKFATNEDLKRSLEDINKAISLKKEPIYLELLDKFNAYVDKKSKDESLINKAKYSYDKAKEKKFSIDKYIFGDIKDQLTQYKILNEMRNKYYSAVKFYSDSKNEDQLDLSYKEIESFMQNFEKFQSYVNMDPENLPENIYNSLSENNKNLLKNPDIIKLINSYKFKQAEDIFSNGNYNFELYKYALDKIFGEEAKERELEEEKLLASQPKSSWSIQSLLQPLFSSKFSLILTSCLIIFSLSMLGINYKLYSSNMPNTPLK